MTDRPARTRSSFRRLAACTLAAATWLGAPQAAKAIEYEVFIDIEEEEDLYDLQATGQISETDLQDIIDVLRRGTDLNTATREQLYALPNLTYEDADRILAYRADAGRIADPAALTIAGVLTRRKLSAIAPFLLVPKAEASKAGVRGLIRYRTAWTPRDRRAPPMALQARLSTLRYFTVGAAATLDRNRLAPVTWDPNRDSLSTTGPRTRPRLVKFFAMWDTPNWGVIAGTYRIGFGQRLIFDTTSRYTPNGFSLDDTVTRVTNLSLGCRESTGELTETPCPVDQPRDYLTPDYRIREGLRGVAIGGKKIPLPVGWMQAYGFASHQTKSIYQYEIYDRAICDDPRLNGDIFPQCSAPDVFVEQPDPLAPAPETSFQTLPNMYNEITGGANATYFFDRRTHVGVTGYGATVDWLVDDADLDFQDAARTPFGGSWGAVGGDAAWGRKWADIFLEVGHSFDSIEPEGGGGPAAILRTVGTWGEHELEASGRYYSTEYANPYARPIAAPDELQGTRARDEGGARLRYNSTVAEIVDLRSFLDVWGNISTETPSLRVFAKGDVQVLPWLAPGLWLDYQNRDLEADGRDRCYYAGEDAFGSDAGDAGSFSASALEFGGAGFCSGERVQVTGRLRFDPHRRASIMLQYRHDVVDDVAYDDRFRQDSQAAVTVGANPVDKLRIRSRIRYDFDDISDNTRLQQTLWAYLQVGYQFQRWFYPSLRYDIRAWLDNRTRTPFRRPNPEHWVHLDVSAKF